MKIAIIALLLIAKTAFACEQGEIYYPPQELCIEIEYCADQSDCGGYSDCSGDYKGRTICVPI